MKTHIKLAFGAFLAIGTSLFSMGAGNGKAPLGQINSHQMVVTQEVDAAFTSWTNSYTVRFPKSSVWSFYIGTNKLSELMPKISESDPKFWGWINTNNLNFYNQKVSFNTNPTNFYVGWRPISDIFMPKSFRESDAAFTNWYGRPSLIVTNGTVNFSKANTNTFKIGWTSIGDLFMPKSFRESDPKFNYWYGTPSLTMTNGTVNFSKASIETFLIGWRPISNYFMSASYKETDPKFKEWYAQPKLIITNQ